jgi:hypothetical protein
MKKSIAGISLLFVMLVPQMARSQKAFISLGAVVAFPTGNFQEVGNSGIGGSLQMEHPWSNHVSGILSIEYIHYETNEFFQNYNEQFSALPFQFGVKYYTSGKSIYPAGFYLSAQMGFTGEFYHTTIKWNNIWTNSDITDTYHETYVGLCNTLGAGYQLGIMDAGFRFQTILSANSGVTSYYNFRLAFTIR